jgi:hypothetical protein
LRVLLILPMLLASLYIAAPAVHVVAHATTGASIDISPASVVTHSIGPAYPLVSPPTNNTITYTISLHNVGPSDMQAWNLVGKVDPNFFAIVGLPLASLSPLKPLCNANFGVDFYTTFSDVLTGKFAASEYCGGLSDGQGYVGTGGVLLTLKLKVISTARAGVTPITLDSSNTFLVTIAGGVSSNIPVTTSNAVFDDSPAFSADVVSANIQGPKSVPCNNVLPSLKCTSSVNIHVPLISNAPLTMRAELIIVRPDHRIDRVASGPIAVSGTGDAFLTYTPPKVGFYQVSAVGFWTEDGVHYIYLTPTQFTRSNADITVF